MHLKISFSLVRDPSGKNVMNCSLLYPHKFRHGRLQQVKEESGLEAMFVVCVLLVLCSWTGKILCCVVRLCRLGGMKCVSSAFVNGSCHVHSVELALVCMTVLYGVSTGSQTAVWG